MISRQRWDMEKAAELARTAYTYVGKTYPADAPLEPLGRADLVVLEAQERGDWDGFVEALRALCRVAKREAIRRERVA
jgi:hypothetical protein